MIESATTNDGRPRSYVDRDTPHHKLNPNTTQINSAAQVIYENVAEDANIIFGAVVDEKLKDQVCKQTHTGCFLLSVYLLQEERWVDG